MVRFLRFSIEEICFKVLKVTSFDIFWYSRADERFLNNCGTDLRFFGTEQLFRKFHLLFGQGSTPKKNGQEKAEKGSTFKFFGTIIFFQKQKNPIFF